MNGLYETGASIPFTRLIRVTPQQATTKIINQTLDGRQHLQIIGQPIKSLDIEVQVDRTGRLILEVLDGTGATFTIIEGTNTYTGRIIELGEFTKPIRGTYRTTLSVAI